MPPPEPARILLLIPHLGGGGAEHVIETLARYLSPSKYDIHLALITESRHNSSPLPPHITIHQLRVSRIRYSASKLLRLIWRLRPHVILSGMAHLNLLVLILRPLLPARTRILVRQNGALSATLNSHSTPRLARLVYSAAYCRSHRIICQTESMAQELQSKLHLKAAKLLVLPNPINIPQIRRSAPSSEKTDRCPEHRLLAIGRLVPEKGFDLLLDAFAALPESFHSAELIIAGTGPQSSALRQQTQTLSISYRVHFAGHTPDPSLLFSHASLYVLSSRTEGLPNALLEAAAAGLPIVATPASPGVANLLRNREGVWLSSEISADALRSALQQAMTAIQPTRRHPHHWIEPYDLSHSIPAYESAIDHAIARSKS
jgi:glycosyltransferase involved in cell wall biosynthesis